VAENIALGDIGRAADRRAVTAAAQKAQMDSVIRGWPRGYDNGLGQWLFTDGVIPSQGQRVRLALARTFFRDAPLCILDEPTAGLDPAAAREISDAIERHTRGRTALIVSHDLDLWPFVDRVVVFERGEIVADGPRAVVAERSQWLSGLIGAQAERPGEFDPAERPYWS
jgi:ABC-type multidrug transport system fused ATPase/permease subunit